MNIVTQAVAGTVDVIGLVPGESIQQTMTGVWSAHVVAHLERCGALTGPLAEWVCRQGHPLYQ